MHLSVTFDLYECAADSSFERLITAGTSLSVCADHRAQSYAERLRLGLAVIHGEAQCSESDMADGRHSPPCVYTTGHPGLELPCKSHRYRQKSNRIIQDLSIDSFPKKTQPGHYSVSKL